MDNRPLLSICIPTYNRANILDDVLGKYVKSKGFDSSVEIVISDNCSTDNTQEVGLKYQNQYPNIKYFRNETNVTDLNFIKVLDYGTGHYLKLLNDSLYPTEDGLVYIKNKIIENLNYKKPIFFTSGVVFTDKKKEIINCNDINDYVLAISTYVTSNSCFGAWREQWQKIEDKSKYYDLKLMQVDWSYQLLCSQGSCVIYDKKVFEYAKIKMGIRGGYNWFKIHLDHYYRIMQPYLESGAISQSTYKKDKKNLLYHFRDRLGSIYIWHYDKNFQYDTKGTFKLFWHYYKHDAVFYQYLLMYPVWVIYFPAKVISKHLWRRFFNK